MSHSPSRCEQCVRTILEQGDNPADYNRPVCGNERPQDPYLQA